MYRRRHTGYVVIVRHPVDFRTNTSRIPPQQLCLLLLQPMPYHNGAVFKPVIWLAAVFRTGSTDQESLTRQILGKPWVCSFDSS